MKGFVHRSTVTRAERAKLAEELTELGMPLGITERACCCPARPVVRVMMPATACRPDPVDLLLCGHHYRVSRAALHASGAAVYDETGALIMSGASQQSPARREPAAAAPRPSGVRPPGP
jgi:hypothetical protein